MPRLTIIVPSTGTPVEFEDTLASILQHRPDDCQVVVACREPYDDPYELGEEVAFPVYPEAATEFELLREAVEHAASDVIGVVMCGVEVEESWEAEPLALLAEEPSTAAVAPVWQRSRGGRQRLEFGLHLSHAGGVKRVVRRRLPRRRLALTSPSVAAAFYRRSVWLAAGGPSSRLPATVAPLELGLKFRHLGYRVQAATGSRVSGEPHALARESSAVRGRAMEWLRRAAYVERRPSWAVRQLARLATSGREPGWSGPVGHGWGTLLGMLDRGYLRRWQEWSDQVKTTVPEIVRLDELAGADGDGDASVARAA